MTGTVLVTPNNHRQVLAGLPRTMRAVLGLAARIECGTLEIRLPDSRRFTFHGPHHGPAAAVVIHSERLAWRLLRSGDIGIAESYLRGEWETPNLTQLLYLFCVNVDAMQAIRANPMMRLFQGLRHWLNRNTRRQARRNIHAHYDLGN
ncbi:MAG: SAM-dependent methyltransferase, partial [Pseudorhodoplanes sp.]|nr:SAM-dependent methyltransferase [Pseudorhodoplanes sp.]